MTPRFNLSHSPVLVIIWLIIGKLTAFGQPVENPMIFPVPAEVHETGGTFTFDEATSILASDGRSNDTGFLPNLFARELADRYGAVIKVARQSERKAHEKFVLIGSLDNALVKSYCDKEGLTPEVRKLGPEGYILSVTANRIIVASNTEKGALWGLSSLRQLVRAQGSALSAPLITVKDAPVYPFRGIKLYLPGRENITFFKRFIRDFVVLYKFNTIILELNANMRLSSHPELNTGAVEFARYLNNNRLDRPPGAHREYQNSSHQDNADGQILEREEVTELVQFMRAFNIEVVPELPALTHSYYLLSGHKDLAENLEQPFPDTYCPLKPAIYQIYFDVLDEYIEVIHPSVIHVGHDEWRMEKDRCALCRGKDYGLLFAGDLIKIHDHLAKKGIRTAIWGDHLLESVRGKDHRVWKTSTGYEYKIPGAMTAEQVSKLIPKDILIFNWFWDDINNDRQLSDLGFQQVYGNLLPEIGKWPDRGKIKGVLGGAPSSWAATTELNIGKDQLYDFLGTANLLWSQHYLPEEHLALITEPLVAGIRDALSGEVRTDPSAIRPLDISGYFNASLPPRRKDSSASNVSVPPAMEKSGTFAVNAPDDAGMNGIVAGYLDDERAPLTAKSISVDRDVNSIIFLHACLSPARNQKAYAKIYDFGDTAELLGRYEITYEDGLQETIPVRYGLNILDWRWRQRIANHEEGKVKYSQDRYAYRASAVDCAIEKDEPVTFFSFEWKNPRPGKVIKEIKLQSAGAGDRNAIMLLAVSPSTSSGTAPSTSSGTAPSTSSGAGPVVEPVETKAPQK